MAHKHGHTTRKSSKPPVAKTRAAKAAKEKLKKRHRKGAK